MSDVLTQEELEELMRQRGMEKLEEHQKFVSFDGKVNTGSMQYEYNKDFFLGDYVSIYCEQLKKYVNLQITSVTRSISEGVEYFDIGFGYDRMKISNIMKG